MLLLSPFTEGTQITDPRFTSRGFIRQRQGPLSDSPYLAIALEKQVAYDGYKSNIDVFLAATCTGETYNINIPGIDITLDPSYTFPLALPRTVISFKPNVPSSIIEPVITAIKKKSEVTRVQGVKGHANCYLIDRPVYSFLKFIKLYVVSFAPKTEGYAQIGETMEAAKILHCIDLYLRTNTYAAFKSDEDITAMPPNAVFNLGVEKRPAFFSEEHLSKRTRYGAGVTMTHTVGKEKKEREEKGRWFGEESDADVIMTAIDSPVFYARPSPAKESKGSWSAPKDVPTMPGMCFPYFNGMISHDKRTLRQIPGQRFLRLFGKEPRENFLFYRKASGGFATSETGIIMTHILAGVDISLETQTKLHLLFDGATYLGFCILGAKWAIQRGGMWHLPKTSEELRTDLDSIVTHASSLREIIDKLADMSITASMDYDGCDLAEALANISWNSIEDEDERKDTQRWFEARVGRLDFGTRPTNFGADTLAEALKDIADESEPLENHVHFPPAAEYSILKQREAIVLARFGYLVPSFIIEKGGNSVRLSTLLADREKGESARKMVSKVLIAMKPLGRAVKDFQIFRNQKHIFQSSGERAANYRLHTLGGEPKDRFLMTVGGIINSIKASSVVTSSGRNVAADTSSSAPVEEFAPVDVPAVFV
jgi:hypothetical protein